MARSSPQDQRVVSPNSGGGGQDLDHAAPETMCHRVVSVSPHSAVSYQVREAQAASHESADSLRAMIAEANIFAERFERTVGEARQEEARTASSTAQLQERLQLSAQMLKAFQSQITRVEISLAELKAQEKKAQVAEARAQQRLDDMETRIESSLDRFSKRLDEMSQAALDRIAEQCETRCVDVGAEKSGGLPAEKADDQRAIMVDLGRLSATMQDLAQQIGLLAAAHGGSDKDSGVDDSAQNVRATQDQYAVPEIHVASPLRFQSWASGA